jgi:hypothetical protein
MPNKNHETPQEILYSGPKIFVDAAWKKRPNEQSNRTGVGVHIKWKQGQHITNVFILAKTAPVASPIQAEAEGLLIAANIASSLLLQGPYFFTDNLGLAKAVQAHGGADPNVLWEIRRHAVQFQETMQMLRPRIFHIKRSLNVLPNKCEHQAKTLARVSPLALAIILLIHHYRVLFL